MVFKCSALSEYHFVNRPLIPALRAGDSVPESPASIASVLYIAAPKSWLADTHKVGGRIAPICAKKDLIAIIHGVAVENISALMVGITELLGHCIVHRTPRRDFSAACYRDYVVILEEHPPSP